MPQFFTHAFRSRDQNKLNLNLRPRANPIFWPGISTIDYGLTIFHQYFCSDFQYQPAGNTFLDEIPYISKAYKIEFEVKLNNSTYPYTTNILQVTARPERKYHATITSVDQQANSSSLRILHGLGYKKNRSFSHPIGLHRFIRVRIMQYLDCNNKYRFSIYFNNVEVFSLTNTRPRELFNALVFFGGPRRRAATNSIIRNFSFTNLWANAV